jgi:hypothetical protein
MLVIQMRVHTPICIMSRAIGGILIRLFPIVSISSIKLIIDIMIHMRRTIRNRFSSRGEKFPKNTIAGVVTNRVNKIIIPAP